MTRWRARLAASTAAFAVLGSLAACGGGDGDGGAPRSPGGSVDASAVGEESNAPTTDDSDGALGPGGGVVAAEAQDADATIEISAAGFDPVESTVAVGDVVRFTAGDGGIYGVVVGDLDGYTVTEGLDAYFALTAPGTYAVGEDISGVAASITVE